MFIIIKTKLFKNIACTLLSSLLLQVSLYPQSGNGRISGYLQDSSTGEPLIYANIILVGTELGAASDVRGYYVVTNIPEGSYQLRISMMGYKQTDRDVKITSSTELREDFEIDPQAVEGQEVVVTAEKARFKQEVEVSRTNFTMRELKNTPSFIETDVFRTLQQLPSVKSQNDFSSALIVRGGSPDENLIMLDGTEIYNPYHLGGLFSTFNADAIADAEFIAGGFPAKYSGRLSSVLNITTKEGNSKGGRLTKNTAVGKYWDISRFKGDITMLSSKALLEGPTYNGAWVLSGRRTYFDKLAQIYYNRVDKEQNWVYYFWDAQFKIFSDINKKNRLTFATFNGMDRLAFQIGEDTDNSIDFNWGWGNNSSSAHWRYVPNSKFFSEFSLSRSVYDFDIDIEIAGRDSVQGEVKTNFLIHNKVADWTAKENLTWYLSNSHTVTLGFSTKNFLTSFDFKLDDVEFFNIRQKPNISSVYLQDEWKINVLLSCKMGLRATKYELHDRLYLEPRFGFKYILAENTVLKGSWGLFNQFLFTTNDDEEEVLRIVDFWEPVPKNFDAQANQQYVLGIEQWFGEGFTGSVEAYYKPYSNVLDNNPMNDPGQDGDEFVNGEGTAWGFELFIKKRRGKLSGWIGYSYSFVEKRVDYNGDGKITETKGPDNEIYNPKYHQPHAFNLVLNYKINKRNIISLSWARSSGQPYTPVVGKVYHSGNDMHNPFGWPQNIRGEKNFARLPVYSRGDLGWLHDFSFRKFKGKFKAQILNFTNHFNVLLYSWDHSESPSNVTAVGMFPIIPSFGVEFEL